MKTYLFIVVTLLTILASVLLDNHTPLHEVMAVYFGGFALATLPVIVRGAK